MRKHLSRLFLLAVALTPAMVAGPFSRMYVYGDSLSDPLFSNGPVAVQYLADKLGIAPGDLNNFAVGGSTTGVGNLLDGGTVTTPSPRGGMTTQLMGTMGSLNPADALFVVWGGPNDFLVPDPGDVFPEGVAARAIGNLVGIVTTLKAAGAQHILVPGLPMLGLTPFYLGQPAPAAQLANALSVQFNAALKASLPSDVIFFDTALLMQQVVSNPGAYGFTNVTDACDGCANPGQYLFWDDFHPTTAAHAIVADRFYATLVPEPSSIVLISAGIGALGFARRLRTRYAASRN